MRAVRFDQYGTEDVLHVSDVEKPEAGGGQVVVRVRVAGVNTGEVGIRDGSMQSMSPAHFPEGEGTELSGVIESVGGGVLDWRPGDKVIGMSEVRGAQADYALLEATNVLPKPDSLGWDTAAVTPTAGATSTAVMRALEPASGETLVVAGASGGVGLMVVQRAVADGVRVIATASERNHDVLRRLGAAATTYGDGLEARIRALAPDGVDAFADCHGDGNVDLAVRLGVPTDRINTIKDFPAAKRTGCKAEGMYQLDDIPGAVQETIDGVADGRWEIPIKARFSLAQVRDAYRRLTEPGGVGKVVLIISADEGGEPAA